MKKMKLNWIALVLVLSLSALLLIACGSREDAGKGLNDEIGSSGSVVEVVVPVLHHSKWLI